MTAFEIADAAREALIDLFLEDCIRVDREVVRFEYEDTVDPDSTVLDINDSLRPFKIVLDQVAIEGTKIVAVVKEIDG